jgi:hypothetical protein
LIGKQILTPTTFKVLCQAGPGGVQPKRSKKYDKIMTGDTTKSKNGKKLKGQKKKKKKDNEEDHAAGEEEGEDISKLLLRGFELRIKEALTVVVH